jgi:tricorn protease-like protein
MDALDIVHVVLEQNGVHTLYVKGGDVILFNPETGKVLSVTKLPSDADVEKARKNPVMPTATSHTLRI